MPQVADDFRPELNWQRRRELRAAAECCSSDADFSAAWKSVFAVERVLEADINKSVQALAAVLMAQLEDDDSDEIPGLYLECLRAILPQLEGSIGADASIICNAATTEARLHALDELGRAERALKQTRESEEVRS